MTLPKAGVSERCLWPRGWRFVAMPILGSGSSRSRHAGADVETIEALRKAFKAVARADR